MIAEHLLWWLLLPAMFGIVTIFVVKKFSSETDFMQMIGLSLGGAVISGLILVAAFYAGRAGKTHDVEILNGEVLGKTREHGQYEDCYDCFCSTSCDSNNNCTTICQTCCDDHYTVTWKCQTNLGEFTIQHLDELSRSVYKKPDPNRYTIINKGDPVSIRSSYTNYIKAVPETLFRPSDESLKAKYAGKIPEYPDQIFDIYRINRVIPVGVTVPDLKVWNEKLSDALKKLGPQKQANAVIVITNYDQDFFYALRDAWQGGKKNDILLVIGAKDFPNKANWVSIQALTTDDMFQVKLRDAILGLETLNVDSVMEVLKSTTNTYFKRKSMKDFKYLEAEIDPPQWVMNITGIMITIAYLFFWYWMWDSAKSNTTPLNRYGMPRFDHNPLQRFYRRY